MYLKSLIVFVFFSLNYSSYADVLSLNKAELEYEIKGNGNTILFFEAGAISGMAGWDPIWNKLPKNTTAIRYSRRGEGKSSACLGDLTSSDYVKDARELVRLLNISKPVIYVSHSYGGKISREFAAKYPDLVSAMLFVDPINPKDVDIIEQLDPIGGKKSNRELKQADLKAGKDNNWCLINDIWDKSPSLGYGDIKNIPITLIAGVKTFAEPQRLFDTDEARKLWGEIQTEWVLQFPQGTAVMAEHSGHFVQYDEPDLVLAELKKLMGRVELSAQASQ